MWIGLPWGTWTTFPPRLIVVSSLGSVNNTHKQNKWEFSLRYTPHHTWLSPAFSNHTVKTLGRSSEGVVISSNVMFASQSHLIQEHDTNISTRTNYKLVLSCNQRGQVQILFQTLTVGSRLAVLWSKVYSSADSTARVRHYAKTWLQNGSHYSHIGAMPKETAVVKSIMLFELVILHTNWVGQISINDIT